LDFALIASTSARVPLRFNLQTGSECTSKSAASTNGRGEDRGNPVILFVHGGRGGSTISISSGWQSWEKYFTVVQWDQSGAGRTFRKTSESIATTMTLARMTQDGVEVAEYLRAHLHKDKIVLIGHSWGSFLGIQIVKQRPDLFYAFVGTGQVVGKQTFERQFELTVTHLKALAQAANNIRALTKLKPISVSPDFRKQRCDTVSFTSPTDGTPECDIVQKWAKGPYPFLRSRLSSSHDGSGGHHPQSCASFSRTDPFLCSAFSAHKRVIADVASSSVQGRRSKCTDARRSNADTAVNITGDGGSARIGVLCEMSRGYMARASHSGSCEHGCGDQCSRQKFKLSHLISPLHEKPTASGSSFWLHDDQR
jgi:pimeloyl-ACP methyl ester carboxylesterase